MIQYLCNVNMRHSQALFFQILYILLSYLNYIYYNILLLQFVFVLQKFLYLIRQVHVYMLDNELHFYEQCGFVKSTDASPMFITSLWTYDVL